MHLAYFLSSILLLLSPRLRILLRLTSQLLIKEIAVLPPYSYIYTDIMLPKAEI